MILNLLSKFNVQFILDDPKHKLNFNDILKLKMAAAQKGLTFRIYIARLLKDVADKLDIDINLPFENEKPK